MYRLLFNFVKKKIQKISDTEIIALRSGNTSIDRNILLGKKINPTKKSFGVVKTLVKSFTDKPRPKPSIIIAKAIGAIFVTISIIYKFILLKNNLISPTNNFVFSRAAKCPPASISVTC